MMSLFAVAGKRKAAEAGGVGGQEGQGAEQGWAVRMRERRHIARRRLAGGSGAMARQ
ncbi:MAG TPA: hypothetical protein VEZ26_09920 [Sphingomonadaceae bacterium]|nr:hypothetical protein [Sphingomonadaceae bacterium]